MKKNEKPTKAAITRGKIFTASEFYRAASNETAVAAVVGLESFISARMSRNCITEVACRKLPRGKKVAIVHDNWDSWSTYSQSWHRSHGPATQYLVRIDIDPTKTLPPVNALCVDNIPVLVFDQKTCLGVTVYYGFCLFKGRGNTLTGKIMYIAKKGRMYVLSEKIDAAISMLQRKIESQNK